MNQTTQDSSNQDVSLKINDGVNENSNLDMKFMVLDEEGRLVAF